MKKLLSILLALAFLLTLAACQTGQMPTQPHEPGSNGASKPISEEPPLLIVQADHGHEAAGEPQTVEDPYSGYCGNTMSTIILDGKEYTFEGSDSVYLTDTLLNLAYDPDKLCDCMAEFTVKTEFGGPYGVNLSQGYARFDGAQADLTKEQIEAIRAILNIQT